jgi:hypothetical protein
MIKDDLREILLHFQQEFKNFRSEVRKTLAEHSRVLDQHTGTLMSIEETLKFYGDMYQVNKESIEKLDKRVGILERA